MYHPEGVKNAETDCNYNHIVWEFIKKPGENTYQIKVRDHFIYLDVEVGEFQEVLCHEILGEPKSSFWILERCE